MRTIVSVVFVLAAGVASAAAQTLSERVFLSVNGGYQVSSDDFTDQVAFRRNAEDSRFEADYEVQSGPAFDVSGGVALWRRLAVAVGVTRFTRSTPTTFSAEVPHPFFFDTPRAVSGEIGGLRREELGVHVQARGILPVGERWQVMVFGGPSFFQVEQDLVRDFSIDESYPYDEATFTGGTSGAAKKSAAGLNGGADVAFFFTRQVGIGFGVQYAGASVDLPSADGGTVELEAGGLQAGAGLRLRF